MTSTIISSSSPNDLQDYIINTYPPNKHQIISIDPDGRSIKIKQIKDLRRLVASVPQLPRIVLISHADTMTTPSQNAILKLLEEPPTNTTFVLTTTNHNMLLETIRSRCILIRLTNTSEVTSGDTLTFIKSVMQANDGERILLVSEIGKTREDAFSWLREAIEALTSSIHKTRSPRSLNVLRDVVTATLKCQNQLQANTNVTLTLENYLLSLPTTK